MKEAQTNKGVTIEIIGCNLEDEKYSENKIETLAIEKTGSLFSNDETLTLAEFNDFTTDKTNFRSNDSLIFKTPDKDFNKTDSNSQTYIKSTPRHLIKSNSDKYQKPDPFEAHFNIRTPSSMIDSNPLRQNEGWNSEQSSNLHEDSYSKTLNTSMYNENYKSTLLSTNSNYSRDEGSRPICFKCMLQ